jgi:membrane protein implicated in regulation of membrane protease activity
MDIYSIIWLSVLVLMIIIEAATVNLVTLWFAVGALFAFLVSLFDAPIWLQIVVFLVISILSLIFLFPLAKKKLKIGKEKTNIDGIIGKTGVVTKEIVFNQIGQIDISGVVWSAKSEEDIGVGQTVEVLKVEGNKVIVKHL